MYSPPGHIDPWVFVGYAFHFSDPLFLPDNYKSSRLPWILLEYGAHSLLPPLAANSILQLGCLTLATVSVFFATERLFGATAALVAAGFLAVYTHFTGAGGADYQNTLSGPLYAATFLVLILGACAREGKWWWWFATGALYAATVHTNILFINFAPVLVVQFLTLRHLRRAPRVPLSIVLASAFLGALLLTIVLGAINWAVGRNFYFFMSQLTFTAEFVKDSSLSERWWSPWTSGWYKEAAHLGALLAGGALAIAVCGAAWRKQSERQILALSISVQYVALLAFWISWQSLGYTALQPDYFSTPLIVPLCLTIGAAYGVFGITLQPKVYALIALVLLGSFLSPLLLWPQLLEHFPSGSTRLVTGVCYFGLAFFVLIFWGRYAVGLVLAIFLLGIANGKVAADRAALYSLSSCRLERDEYTSIVGMHQILASLGRAPSKIYIWFDEHENAHALLCPATYSLASLGYSLVASGFQYLQDPWPLRPIEDLDVQKLRAVAKDDVLIAILSRDRQNFVRLTGRLRELGQTLQMVSEQRIAHGNVDVSLFVARPVPIAYAPPP